MNGKQRKKQTWPFRETWKQPQEHWSLKQNKTHKKALRKPHSSGKRKWFKGISSQKTTLHSSSDCWGAPEIFYTEQGCENGQMLATTQQMIIMWGDISGPQPASTQLSHFHGVSNWIWTLALCLSCAVTSFPEQNTEEHLQIYTDFDLQTQMPARKKTSAESFLFLAVTFLPPFSFMSDHFFMRGSPASVSQNSSLGRIGGFALSSCGDIFSTRSPSCWAANTVPLFWQCFSNNHGNHHK